MFTAKSKTKAATKGQGAAAAKQLGLFVDFSCEDMISGGDDNGGDLEAELAEITGVRPVIKPNSKEKVPLPMDHIKQMAEECMKDVVENDDDDDFEKDEELLAELEEVVGNEEEGSSNLSSPTDTPVSIKQLTLSLPQSSTVSVNTGGLQGTLEERIQIYMVAINNAKQTGENSKMRRYERGLKTLQAMLASVKKGEIIEEVEIPPPVAIGKSSAPVLQPDGLNAESVEAENTEDRVAEMLQDTPANSNVTVLPVVSSMPESHNVLAESATVTQSDISDVSTATISDGSGCDESKTKALLFGRQKEYKLAALTAKQQGNITTALEYVKMSKKFDIAIKALQNGEPVDLNNLPLALTGTSTQDKSPKPSSMVNLPDQQGEPKTELQVNIESGALPPPRDVLEALYQRMEKYKTAAAQAKANGNDRKARMHERIVKQYHDAIRAQKAGRKVDFGDLPIPPGFPAIPGVGRTSGYLGIAGTLQAASRLAAAEVEVKEDGDESGTPQSAAHSPVAKRSTKHADHMVQSQTAGPTLILPAASEERQSLNPIKKPLPNDPLIQQSAIAQQQLELLQNRRKQYMKAALQAKQKENLEQAKHFIRTAKVFDPLILAVQNGKSIDISKVPSPPEDEDEDDNDFIIVHHKDVQISPNVDEVYTHLTNLLKEQYEKCMSYSKQFTHLGNVAETTKFEKMAVDCKKNLEILKLGQAQGLDPPKYHFEERTLKTVRIFSDLSSTEMLLIIVKGINLPAPSGVAAHDLDAFVKFEFQYPSTEQAQRNKTTVIKNTNCPEYNERFILNINRNHRGFKRIIQTKGIKFEVFHKGGFFRSDKPVGTAQLKLDKLETECEVREIVEIFDGRKSTGGRLELKVRMREPLNRQDMQTITEKWLILDLTTRCKTAEFNQVKS